MVWAAVAAALPPPPSRRGLSLACVRRSWRAPAASRALLAELGTLSVDGCFMAGSEVSRIPRWRGRGSGVRNRAAGQQARAQVGRPRAQRLSFRRAPGGRSADTQARRGAARWHPTQFETRRGARPQSPASLCPEVPRPPACPRRAACARPRRPRSLASVGGRVGSAVHHRAGGPTRLLLLTSLLAASPRGEAAVECVRLN